MSKRKAKYIKQPFESMGDKFIYDEKIHADTSANIFESMLLSDAYTDLLARQQQLYTLCKAQWRGKRKPNKDYPDMNFSDECFYFNRAQVMKYKLYTEKSASNFYKDMGVLIAHGFIVCKAQGNLNGRKSIYEFSDKWQTWKQGDDFNPKTKA